MRKQSLVFALSASMILGSASTALCAGHTWYVNEIFSNSDGTIQFIEIKESLGGNFETGTAGHAVTSSTKSFTITANSPAPTGFHHILLATPAFVGLPGAPTPDYIIPAGSVPFFNKNGDVITYVSNCSFTLGAGVLPTDGVNSLTVTTHHAHATSIGVNSPTNYAGQTGSINATVGVGEYKGTLALRIPNPVVGSVAVSFSVPGPGRTKLAVFDVSGRLVASRDYDSGASGWQTVRFDKLAAGHYTARLTQGGRRTTLSFAVIR
jgi:hypothetical protein